MKISFDDFGIYNVDVPYLEYLHGIDSEVYFNKKGYENKPFLGLIIGIDSYTYFIPFSSAKPRHTKWKNVAPDHFLVYEMVNRNCLGNRAVFKQRNGNGDIVEHILAVLDIKKMIPVPDGIYHKIHFDYVADQAYRSLLIKEYQFCRKIRNDIGNHVERIYSEQKSSGKVYSFYCNFMLLEDACDSYIISSQEDS